MLNPTQTPIEVRTAPGPRGNIILGNLPEVQRKGFLKFYLDAWRDYGDVARYQMGPMVIHSIVRPEHVQHVLVKNAENYHKGLSHDKLRIALGNGLLTSEGPFWSRQRRLMSPTYTPRGVTRFAEIMTSAAADLLGGWQPGRTIAVNQEMMVLAMNVISRSMFGIDLGDKYADAGRALGYILEFAAARTMSIIDPPLFIPTPANNRLKWALRTIDDFLYGIIAERRLQPPGDDLLHLLMSARDEETGETMDEKQLRDEVLITFFAGHETTAQLFSWTAYMLDQHPQVESRLHAELEDVLSGRTPTLDDLPRLVYTRQVVDEVLRLYSPVAVTARDVIETDEIGGYAIPAGSMVMVAPYLSHRHPEFWETPLQFNPEHFTPEAAKARPRYAYYPFGAGQRTCLGMHFALLEAVLVLGEVLQRYRFRLLPGQEIEPVFMGTLRPCGDIMMKLEAR